MEIELPTTGCSIFYGSYIDHYTSNGYTRTRYYINEGKLVKNNTSSSNYNSIPSGATCLQQGDLVYRPELEVYIPFLASSLFIFALILVYKIFIKRLLP